MNSGVEDVFAIPWGLAAVMSIPLEVVSLPHEDHAYKIWGTKHALLKWPCSLER